MMALQPQTKANFNELMLSGVYLSIYEVIRNPGLMFEVDFFLVIFGS